MSSAATAVGHRARDAEHRRGAAPARRSQRWLVATRGASATSIVSTSSARAGESSPGRTRAARAPLTGCHPLDCRLGSSRSSWRAPSLARGPSEEDGSVGTRRAWPSSASQLGRRRPPPRACAPGSDQSSAPRRSSARPFDRALNVWRTARRGDAPTTRRRRARMPSSSLRRRRAQRSSIAVGACAPRARRLAQEHARRRRPGPCASQADSDRRALADTVRETSSGQLEPGSAASTRAARASLLPAASSRSAARKAPAKARDDTTGAAARSA